MEDLSISGKHRGALRVLSGETAKFYDSDVDWPHSMQLNTCPASLVLWFHLGASSVIDQVESEILQLLLTRFLAFVSISFYLQTQS